VSCLPLLWQEAKVAEYETCGINATACCRFFLPLSHHILFSVHARTSYGGERYEKRDMQQRVREKFGELQKLDEARGLVPWRVVNAAQTVEQVESNIWEIVSETVERCKDKPVKKMWQEGDYDMSKHPEQEKENSS